ncbi:hypothetical protein [Prochlorococcus marinus]|uniref:hypothetical protein n=1 Tax=Prochlorococcus marinus TaxID=1219 RepID=UPI0002F7A8DD|nr:hypothetical protein [Prochlorococcus marinus]
MRYTREELTNHLHSSDSSEVISPSNFRVHSDDQKILCKHCKRTSSNSIRCLGICVADNDY